MVKEGQDNPVYYDEEAPKKLSTAGNLLGVDFPSDVNSHTYVYEPDKSLRRMTVEALPAESNYRDLRTIGEQYRPTMDELVVGQKAKKEDLEERPVEQKKGKVVKFGWVEGVFMRCLLNIWGVMLFLRLTWVIGQCGIWQGIVCMTICNIITGLTAISMSAVATNGQISGGGVYYMISRALGPEFGGAIGLMFTIANSISVATYTIGFCESVLDLIRDMFKKNGDSWNGIVDMDLLDVPIDVRILGGPVLIFIIILAIVGMDWVTRVQKALLFLLIFAQVDMLVGSFLPDATLYITDAIERKARGFTGWSMETGTRNMDSLYVESYTSNEGSESFMSVFGVFFTAVTGIVAGANLSGDLKDPGAAIPKGTLGAIVLTYFTYVFYGIMVGFTYLNQASGNVTEYKYWTDREGYNMSIDDSIMKFDNCTTAARHDKACQYGTGNDQQTMTVISATGYLIYAGCYAATLSSAIASFVGAPRVLQAVGKDKIYPLVDFFAPGYGANNDPFRGYVLVFLIAAFCLVIGDLNTVGTLATNFFLASYALMNFSVFHSSLTKSPGWRPSFKYYNPWVSLVSAVICVVFMFLMEGGYIYGSATVGITALLYLFILYRKPESNWGSSAQAQVFVMALRSAHSLQTTPDHVKNYRPKIIALTGNPAHRPPLVDFANILTKKMSLLICGHVITDTGPKNLNNLRQNVQMWLSDHSIKAFYSVTQNPSFEVGVKDCLNLVGLGKMSPNMVLLGFKSNWKSDLYSLQQYFNIINSTFELSLSLAILRIKDGLDYSSHIAGEEVITREVPVAADKVYDEEGLAPPKADGVKTRKVSTAVYRGSDGLPLANNLVSGITQFQQKKRRGNIDVWWLYDDGGLTLLLPHILSTRKQFKDCKLRVFSLANKKEGLDRETRNMAALLAKFRIDYSDVIVIPDVTKKADERTKKEFDEMMSKLPAGTVEQSELQEHREKTNRHLRLAELMREYSRDAEIVVMTLPVPKRDHMSAALYMAWLDIMTKDMPPVLLTRGNQASVLTFYS